MAYSWSTNPAIQKTEKKSLQGINHSFITLTSSTAMVRENKTPIFTTHSSFTLMNVL